MTRLELTDVSAGYNGALAIRNVNIRCDAGEVVLLAGPNGAGKTTTLLTIAGVLPASAGEVRLDGRKATRPLHARARAGLGLITEKKPLFMTMTVRDNLRLGRGTVEAALECFPELEARLDLHAGLLSGGEQQMLVLARVLAGRPTVILADELSTGLAPVAMKRLLPRLRKAAEDGAAVLLVEQMARQALPYADRVYTIKRGAVQEEAVTKGSAQEEKFIRSVYF